MRRFALVALVFVPGLLAVWFLREWSLEETAVIRSEPDSPAAAPRTEANRRFVGTRGKGTFLRKIRRAEVDGESVEYPAWYYYVGSWYRDEADRFQAEDLFVLMNPRPAGPEDLEGILRIQNDEPSEERLERLLTARETKTSLRAATAVLSGAETIEQAREIELTAGVEVGVVDPSDPDSTIRIESGSARARLDGNGLAFLELPTPFMIRHPLYDLAGQGLRTEIDSPDVVVERDVQLVLRRNHPLQPNVKTEFCRLDSRGALVFTPDRSDERGDLLRLIRIQRGSFSISDGVVVTLEGLTLECERLSGFILGARRESEGSGPPVEQIDIAGPLVVKSRWGKLEGSSGTLKFLPDDGFALEVHGSPVRITWGNDTHDGEGRLTALCRGPLRVIRPSREEREVDAYRIELRDAVQIDSRDEARPLALRGRELDLFVRPVASNRVAAKAGDTVLELVRGVLRGDVTGVVNELEMIGPVIDLERRFSAEGLLIDEIYTAAGPARVIWRRVSDAGDMVESNAITEFTVQAREEIAIARAASPFADSVAKARGAVVGTGKRGDGGVDTFACDLAELRIGPVRRSTSTTDRLILKRFVAQHAISGRAAFGLGFSGDELDVDLQLDRVRLEGRPAAIRYLDAQDREHTVNALGFHVDRPAGRLTARGAVACAFWFPGLVLTGEKKEGIARAKRELEDPPSLDILWQLACDELVLLVDQALATKTMTQVDVVEARAQGHVHLENPDQTLDASAIFLDLREKSGWGEGEPLRLRYRRTRGAAEVTDELDAQRVVVRPDRTLLSGTCRALLYVRAHPGPTRQSGITAEEWEPLHVRCDRDILLRPESVYFTGRTEVMRGETQRGGLRLTSGSALAHLTSMDGGVPRMDRLEAFDDVRFTWGDLTGSGDVLDLDRLGERVELRARDGSCEMSLGTRAPTRASTVVYDMKRRLVTGRNVRGEVRRSRE